ELAPLLADAALAHEHDLLAMSERAARDRPLLESYSGRDGGVHAWSPIKRPDCRLIVPKLRGTVKNAYGAVTGSVDGCVMRLPSPRPFPRESGGTRFRTGWRSAVLGIRGLHQE